MPASCVYVSSVCPGDTVFFDELKEIPRRFPDIDLALLHAGSVRRRTICAFHASHEAHGCTLSSLGQIKPRGGRTFPILALFSCVHRTGLSRSQAPVGVDAGRIDKHGQLRPMIDAPGTRPLFPVSGAAPNFGNASVLLLSMKLELCTST